jgi:citrate lyase subunit beta/citryl-CoA lyase
MHSESPIKLVTGAQSHLSPTLARSWWLVSGAAALSSNSSFDPRPDAMIFDLEDGVAPQQKDAARAAVVAALEGQRAWVRINDTRSPYWANDVHALAGLSNLAGVMVAKTDSPTDIDAVARRLPQSVPLIAFIETATALEAAREIAEHPRVCRLAFGSGDFRMDLGAGAGADALAYARARLVVVSRAAELPGPIDGPTVVDDQLIVEQETAYALSLGMSGRLCLDASHADTINSTLSPGPGDIADAHALIAQLGPDGAHATKGSDLPRLSRAHRVIQLAHQFGLV